MDNYSLADIRAATEGDNDWGGNGSWWIILLFIVFFGGGGLWGNRGNCCEQPVTEAGLCNAMNFNNLENAVGRLSDNQAAIARQTDNAICNLGYRALEQTNETQRVVYQGDYALSSQMAAGNYETQKAIDKVRYDDQKNTCDILTAIKEDGEATRALIRQNEIQALRDKVSGLELKDALCGVIRYPNNTCYSAGPWPFGCGGCNNGCCGNDNRTFF